MMMSMTKKVDRGAKMMKNRPQQSLKKKTTKWSPSRAARTRGAEGSQGAFMTRSREAEFARCLFCFKKKNINAVNDTASASVAMCEAFLDACVAYSHD
jgi:hypothetical protein